MTKRMAILVMALGMFMGLASRVTSAAFARPQDEKMQSQDQMGAGKMSAHKMGKKSKKHKKHKKDKKDKMNKMNDQGKMDEQKN